MNEREALNRWIAHQDLSRAEMGSVVKLAREWWETHKADRTE